MSRHTLIHARGRPAAPPPVPEGLDRREALAWLASGSAALLAGCEGKPPGTVAPAVETPDGQVAGEVRRYATTVPLAGYDRGVVGLCRDGRPVKLEGSPHHPASLGATDVFAEAEILSLYDPGRLRTPETEQGPQGWQDFADALAPRMARARARGGEGFTLFTGRITSPTELRLIRALQASMPKMAWRRWEPTGDDAAREGSRLAFGRVLDVRPRLAECAVVLCLDADPLGPGPDQVAHGRAFAAARTPGRTPFLRLYAAEPGWSLTGMNADHRFALRPEAVTALAYELAERFGLPRAEHGGSGLPASAVDTLAADLEAAHGRALVLAGPNQPAQAHALAHWINARLAAPVDVREPVDPHGDDHGASLAGFRSDLQAGRVETLLVLDADPVFGAPGATLPSDVVRRVEWSTSASRATDETTQACRWRLPLAHPLESWGDGRSTDGTAAIRQPLVRPLHDGRSAAQLLAMLAGAAAPDGQALVRDTWAERGGGGAFDTFWTGALVDGVVAASAPAPLGPPSPAAPPAPPSEPASRAGMMSLTLSPDPTVYDGRYADNAWLQECPKPLTMEVWGASVAISPADARRLGVETGDHVRIDGLGRAEAPVRVTPGQADGVLTAHLGGGRRSAGPIGSGVGWDLSAVRSGAPHDLVTVAKALGRGRPPTFARAAELEGEALKLSPVMTLSHLNPKHGEERDGRGPSLYPDRPAHEPAWAMVIDAAACIGCNACVVSCQAENNVPVVGPQETARGRDMHWLRIDTYLVDERPAFQPVPCMQCEHAPCEPVCPVEASVHDHEGLNDQVYNRCIGTRFCQSNCPYKVRRFNFHGYAEEQPYKDLGDPAYAAGRNPDVTVRARGVMEKCTYCVQRIAGARQTAEREGRPIRPGEVKTACQTACPTNAIRFGDLSEAADPIHAQKADPRHYALLGELGTRPRTTYLARLRNPNPALEPEA